MATASEVGENAPLYALADDEDQTLNIDYALSHWLNNQFSPSKINLGLATYVRSTKTRF